MKINLEWQLSNNPNLDISSAVSKQVGILARRHLPDLADMFPLQENPQFFSF